MAKRIIFIILAVIMLINLGLSITIAMQKQSNDDKVIGEFGGCFDQGGGCYTVQTSDYAITFGMKNPYYGMIAFPLLAIALLIVSIIKNELFKKVLNTFITIGLVIASIFSLWLLYVQFFILNITCIYCLWVDGLTIASLLIWLLKNKLH